MDIICTLGPSTLNEQAIRRFTELGVTLMRINMSHTQIEDLQDTLRMIKQNTSVDVCIDTEGAQIRTGNIDGGRTVIPDNSIMSISSRATSGNGKRLSFYPDDVYAQIRKGDIIHIDFDSVMGVVVEKGHDSTQLRVLTGGEIGQNKAVTVERDIALPPLTMKDCAAIEIGLKNNVSHFAMSFVNRADDIEYAVRRFGKGLHIISKIETIQAICNIDEILEKSDAILIDRGDLSRQVPIERIARVQKDIIGRAKMKGSRVYVATNLLESMIKSKSPTRAEVNDVFNTLCDGADGLVLAAETAIGRYPIHCVMMIRKIIAEHYQYSTGCRMSIGGDELKARCEYFLNEPHGGNLVNRVNQNCDLDQLRELPRLDVVDTVLLDAEQIAMGTYSPLEGFMTRADIDSVLRRCRLSSGVVWPLPIVLQVDRDVARGVKVDKSLALASSGGEVHATVHVDEVYEYDLREYCGALYGTTDTIHPGVQMTMCRGNYFIGGKVSLVRMLPSLVAKYELSPHAVRRLFDIKGWSKIVGFHTRNVAHRAHEHIQLHAMASNKCDGIFISPVSGAKKAGDYCEDVIFRTYEMIINKYYPAEKVVLGAFKTYSRFAGPREAVFTALCRKNFGCTHFIVGRDHTGVGDFYKKNSVQDLFHELGNIGIEPVFYEKQHYCGKCGSYVGTCAHGQEDIREISGSEGRRMISVGMRPPDWFMREDISGAVIDMLKNGGRVFES